MEKKIVICVVCGKEFEIVKNKRNITCGPVCKKLNIKNIQRLRAAEQKKKKQEEAEKKDALKRLTMEAAAAGMTYGKYVAMLEMEKAKRGKENDSKRIFKKDL